MAKIVFDSPKKPYFKTIVTEVKSHVVDKTSKQSLYKQTVSAAISESDQYEKIDFNVSSTDHYTINSFNNLFHLSTLVPVKLIMMGMGESPFDKPVDLPDKVYNTASIMTPDSIISGSDIKVRISDPDIPEIVTSIGAVAYNANTGETEHFDLPKIGVGTYEGIVKTYNSFDTGKNFDGLLHTFVGQIVQIMYSDPANTNKKRENITANIHIQSPSMTAVMESRDVIVKGKPIPVIVTDDETRNSIPLYIQNVTTGISQVMDAQKIEEGKYGISIPTVEFDGFNSFNPDGSMGVASGHIVRITYTDNNDIRGMTTNVTKDVTVVGGIEETANIEVNDSVYQGEFLDIHVEDYDSTGNQIAVTVSNVETGKYTVVVLNETIAGSGIFEGRLFVSDVETEAPNSIFAENNDTLNVVYVDNAGTISISENSKVFTKPVVEAEPETEEPTEDDDDVTVSNTGTVEFLVNGTFVINGRFKGLIRIEGNSLEPSKCTMLLS